MPSVLVGPAPMKEIEAVYGPLLREAGFEVVFPAANVQMTEAELIHQLPGHVATLAGSEPYTRRALEAGAKAGLLCVCRAGVGYDGVDVQAATDLGIAVGYAPGSNHEAVGEHAMMLIAALRRKLFFQDEQTRAGKWPRKAVPPVRGATLGVIGLGRTGKATARRARAMGMTVLAADPVQDEAFAKEHGIIFTSHEAVFRAADVLTLHTPLTPETQHLLRKETIAWLKPSAYVVNTSRGPVVHEADLVEALKANRIAGAAIDVFDDEPIPANHPYCELKNVILTAHIAGVDLQSRDDMARIAAETIRDLLCGEFPTERIVNPEVRKAFEERKKLNHKGG
jgi:D-3-phosphoglycerate dehydrogenase / 2-oxoglutarate reductase